MITISILLNLVSLHTFKSNITYLSNLTMYIILPVKPDFRVN